jgi:thiol-disulfide isomerase/thioredoxin
MAMPMTRWWNNRWLRATAVAAMLGAWPACNSHIASPESAEQAPLDFVLTDVSGQDVDLAAFRGQPLVINFWATWCGPCRVEVPWFVEFADKYRDQGLTIVGISVDDVPEDIEAFSEEFDVNYPMLVGKGREDVAEAFDAQTFLPVSWIIRPDGTVQARTTGIQEGKEWFDLQLQAIFRHGTTGGTLRGAV